MTPKEYAQLPDATNPPDALCLPQFTVEEETDFDTKMRRVYHRARLWIMAEDRPAPGPEASRYIQVMLTLDREIVRQYPADMLADLVKKQLVEAFQQKQQMTTGYGGPCEGPI